jgi:tetratricopeptide (TPR) repeat protein
MTWRARPVFVSGTFRDMHEERDLLASRAFPALEEHLSAYYTTLERVDLRIGIEASGLSDDHARQALVLKVCLADVRRCRPFLIILIGDRYGWVPPLERSRAAVTEAGLATTLEGKSVTALEIEYGLWGDRDQQTRSRVYFRQLDYEGMDEAHAAIFSDERAAASPLISQHVRAEAAGRAAALQATKRRLQADPILGQRCRNYPARWDPIRQKVTGLATFVETVMDDLLPELIAEAKEQVAAAAAGVLPSALDEFVAERARGFKGRETLLGRLIAHATDPAHTEARIHVLAGAAGSGKSAVFARVCQELTARGGEIVLLAHAAGIDARPSPVSSMLRSWVTRLSRMLGVEDPFERPVDAGQRPPRVEEVFAHLLTRASGKVRVVMAIDALDRMARTPQAEHVTWLAMPLPPNVRMVVTAIDGSETAALAKRADVISESLPPVTEQEAWEIAAGVYARYHREPNTDAVGQLLATRMANGAPSYGNALWLVSALEELNLLDSDHFVRVEAVAGDPAANLHAMVVAEARSLPGDLAELYRRIFIRAGHGISDDPHEGALLASAFTTTIAVSRAGFRERDLSTLVPGVSVLLDPLTSPLTWNALTFAALRRALRAHLTLRGEDDRWDFHHGRARAALTLSDQSAQRRLHALVADYLLTLPIDDEFRESESMHHLLQSGDLTRALTYYGGDLSPRASAAATQVLAAAIAQQRTGEPLAETLLTTPGGTDAIIGRACERYANELMEMLASSAPLEQQAEIASAAAAQLERLTAIDREHVGRLRALSILDNHLFNIRLVQGHLSDALGAQQVSYALADRLATADPENANWQRALAISDAQLGEVLESQGRLPAALDAYRRSLDRRQRLAAKSPGNLDAQRVLSLSYDQVGDVLLTQGKPRDAAAAYQAGLTIREGLVSAEPDNAYWQRHVSWSRDRLGNVMKAEGDLTGALALYRANLATDGRLAAAEPTDVLRQHDLAVSYGRVGDVLESQDKLAEAVDAYEAGTRIVERLTADDPGHTRWQNTLASFRSDLAHALLLQDNLPAALSHAQASLAIREHLASLDSTNAEWRLDQSVSYTSLGKILLEQGKIAEALEMHRAALRIVEQLAAGDASHLVYQQKLAAGHGDIAKSLIAQGDRAGALQEYQTGRDILVRSVDAHPDDHGLLQALRLSHDRIGETLKEQGDLAGALESFRQSLAVAERVAAADPTNPRWQRALCIGYINVGDAHLALEQLQPALEAYQANLAIQERLAAADPLNPQWQKNLLMAYFKVGAHPSLDAATAAAYTRASDQTLRHMRDSGMVLEPPLARLLEEVERSNS